MIRTDSIALGPILPIDLPALCLWDDDPAITRLNRPYVPQNLQRQSDFWLNAGNDRERVFFAIRKRPSPDIIGHVQIMEIEAIHRSAVLGILIGKVEDRGQGYGRQAMQLAIDYCWRHLNLRRLSLRVHTGNAAAIALYRQLGFEIEGVLRQAEFIDGGWTDITLMALIRAEA